MSKTLTSHRNTSLENLEKEMTTLRKKLFVYETLQAEKEIKKGQVKGPFKNGKDLINHIKI
jgi:hypothetical protein